MTERPLTRSEVLGTVGLALCMALLIGLCNARDSRALDAGTPPPRTGLATLE